MGWSLPGMLQSWLPRRAAKAPGAVGPTPTAGTSSWVPPAAGAGPRLERRKAPPRPKRTWVRLMLEVTLLVGVVGLGLGLSVFGARIDRLEETVQERLLEVEALVAANTELQEQLERVVTERAGDAAQIEGLEEHLMTSTVALAEAQEELEALRWRFERVEESRASLEARVTELLEARMDRQAQLQGLEAERAELTRSLGRLRERLAFAERDYQQLAERAAGVSGGLGVQPNPVVSVRAPEVASRVVESSEGATVELSPIIVQQDAEGTLTAVEGERMVSSESPPGEPSPRPVEHDVEEVLVRVRGRLIEVNSAQQFVVVDKGTLDRVRVGMTFDILRGTGSVIGQVLVVRVRSQLAACDIVKRQPTEALQVGDLAVESIL